MNLTKEQEKHIEDAGKSIKKAFPDVNTQIGFVVEEIYFNLSKKHNNVNFNMNGTWKQSGIL